MMILIAAAGCFLGILAPVLRWIACDRMDDKIYDASVLSLCASEILIGIYLIWFFTTRV